MEDYFIRYVNKGLYKCLMKDMDNGVSVEYMWNEFLVSCQLSDGIFCMLESMFDYWDCFCLLDYICKYVLILILYYQCEYQMDEEVMG